MLSSLGYLLPKVCLLNVYYLKPDKLVERHIPPYYPTRRGTKYTYSAI